MNCNGFEKMARRKYLVDPPPTLTVSEARPFSSRLSLALLG